MPFQNLAGGSILTVAMLIVSVGTVVWIMSFTVFSVFYQRIAYGRFYRPRYRQDYRPRCSIIIPCKGLPRGLESNIESFFRLDYPSYEVLCTVESEEDEAVKVIRSVTAHHPNARLVVAGLSTACAQKNHNQIEAVRRADNPEVLVFADADIGPRPDWLRELVLPLSSPEVRATTGFRWQYSSTGAFGEQVHTFMNNFLYVLFSGVSYLAGLGLWGGSMAMRTEDFERLGVGRRWAETVVDDMSLSEILMKTGNRAVLVTPCITSTDDALKSVRDGIRWFERQCMFLKAYHHGTWILGMILVSILIPLLVWLPAAAGISALSGLSFWEIGGGASLVLCLGVFASMFLHPLLGKNPTFGRYLLYQPVSLFWFLVGVFRTSLTDTIVWSGIRYKMTGNGRVEWIERPGHGRRVAG